MDKNRELVEIITKFANCGWDLIDTASKAWLETAEDSEEMPKVKQDLIEAVEKADEECGSCGCEFDPMYKKALELLKA